MGMNNIKQTIMIKNLLFSMVLSAFAVTASAQTTLVKQMPKKNIAKAEKFAKLPADMVKPTATGMWVNMADLNTTVTARKAPMKAGEQYEEQFWWAHAKVGALTAYNLDVNYPSTFDFATIVPAGYEGAVIDSIAFFIASKSTVSNVRAWVGSNVYADIAQADGGCYSVTDVKDFSDAPNHTNYVKLAQPYTVSKGGCFVGYSFTMSQAAGPLILWCGEDENPEAEVDGGTIVRHNDITGGQWMSAYGAQWGNVAIMAHLKIPEMPLAMSAVGIVESVALPNTDSEFVLYIASECYKSIENISYVLKINDVATAEQTFTFPSPLPAKEQTAIYLPYKTPADLGMATIEVEITKVNGEENKSETKSAIGNLIVIEKSAERISVVEEFTGTWCGYCPAGHVGLENIKRDLGNSVITLAGHATTDASIVEPMQCNKYVQEVMADWAYSFPSMAVDRNYVGNPYAGLNETWEYGATVLVNAVKQVYHSEATVALKADWTGADSTAIAVEATASFLYDRYDGADTSYGFAFILSEDGMSGTGSEWLQANYFSGAQGMPADLGMFTGGGQYVQMSYNHVVVDCWDATAGAAGSVKEVIADYPAKYTTTLSIAGNTLIQKKTNLHLTALLISRNNGSIVNAAQVPLGAGAASGIDGVVADGSLKEVARYNANGVKLSAPQKGLNIVKLSNGSTIKLMVK